jgi:hypothetical protein
MNKYVCFYIEIYLNILILANIALSARQEEKGKRQ